MSKDKRDWNKIVSESRGSSIWLPEKFQKDAEAWQKAREAYNEKVKEMAQKEMAVNHALNNLIFGIREYLAQNGQEDIWLKDVGFETAALEEGKFILNLIDPSKDRLPIQ